MIAQQSCQLPFLLNALRNSPEAHQVLRQLTSIIQAMEALAVIDTIPAATSQPPTHPVGRMHCLIEVEAGSGSDLCHGTDCLASKL